MSLRAKNIALHYPPPTSSHFLSQLLSLHLAPLQGLCVFAVPSAWCDFLCFILMIACLTSSDFCSGCSLEISSYNHPTSETPHPSYPDLLFCHSAHHLPCTSFVYCLPSQLEYQLHKSRDCFVCWCIPASQRGFQKAVSGTDEQTWPCDLTQTFLMA